MSRRRTISTILIFAAIAVAGFILGRLVLPRIILRNMEKKMEVSEFLWHTGKTQTETKSETSPCGCSEWKCP